VEVHLGGTAANGHNATSNGFLTVFWHIHGCIHYNSANRELGQSSPLLGLCRVTAKGCLAGRGERKCACPTAITL